MSVQLHPDIETLDKESLCYSIYSNLISFDGALGIMTGVDPQHVDKALALIEEQVESCGRAILTMSCSR